MTPEQLGEVLFALWRRILSGREDRFFTLLDELGLSLSHAKALHVLEHHADELTVKELSEQLGISLPSASRTVDALLGHGWAERREDEHDRRMKRVRISPEGRAVARRLIAARLEGLQAFAASLEPEERARVHAALSSLTRSDDKD